MKTPLWIAIKYAKLYMGKLDRFSIKNYSPFLATARCRHCGDSQTNKVKTRFYGFEKDGSLGFYCHNCGHSASLEHELKRCDEYLYRELLSERFASGTAEAKPKQEKQEKNQHKLIKTDEWRDCLVPIRLSPSATRFLENRQIPKKQWEHLYYTKNLKHTYVDICESMHFAVDQSKKIPEFECIFIPFLNEDGTLTFSTSRNMDPTSDLRYVTLEFQPSYKIFGLNRVDKLSKIYVCEGPLDSLFIDNAIAVGDAALDRASQVLPKENLILIPDNEPRAPVQLKRIASFIEKGYNVVLWPEHIKEKDINDLAKAGYDVQEIIELNTYQGLTAKLKFKNWAKI